MNCFLINQNIKTTTWRETLLTLPKNGLCRKYTKIILNLLFLKALEHQVLVKYHNNHFYRLKTQYNHE